MDADFVRTRLFQPFASTKKGGFGVGAFEAKSLISAMGGRLTVESKPGEGSSFTITLPAAEPAAEPKRKTRMSDQNRTSRPADRRGRRGPAAPAEMGL